MTLHALGSPNPGEGSARPARGRRGSRLGIRFALILALGPLAGIEGRAEVDQPLRYALCRQNVASVEVVSGGAAGAPFGIAVQLEKAAAEDFARVTHEHVGRTLEIAFADWLFARADIRSRIRSGLIINQAYSSEAEAEGALRQLKVELPEEPCGVVS
jgi:hypothetical protein